MPDHHRRSLGLIHFDDDGLPGAEALRDLDVRAFGQAGGHRYRCDFAASAVVDPYRVRPYAVLLDRGDRDGQCVIRPVDRRR